MKSTIHGTIRKVKALIKERDLAVAELEHRTKRLQNVLRKDRDTNWNMLLDAAESMVTRNYLLEIEAQHLVDVDKAIKAVGINVPPSGYPGVISTLVNRLLDAQDSVRGITDAFVDAVGAIKGGYESTYDWQRSDEYRDMRRPQRRR